MEYTEIELLKLSIQKLSEAFDSFVGSCMTEDEKPQLPDYKSLIKARGYLPPYCKNSLVKRKI